MRDLRSIRDAATLVTAAVAVVVLLVAGPAGAVIGGTDDTDNFYENVGVLQLQVGEASGSTSARARSSARTSC